MSNISAKALEVVTALQPVASQSSLNDDGLIELSALGPFIPFHPQHIRKLARKGLFPKPVEVPGCRRTVFLRRDIWRYLEKIAKANAKMWD